jgi:ribosomal protein L2
MEEEKPKMTAAMRYYRLHRDERLAKKKEARENDPNIQARKEERERKKIEKTAEKAAEKTAEKAVKQIERERKRQEQVALALETSKKKDKFIAERGRLSM